MNDDPRIDELLAPLRDHESEPEAHRPTIDRDRVLARMASAAKRARLERVRRTSTFFALAVAGAVAATLGLAHVRSRAPRASPAQALDVTAISGEVAVQGGNAQDIATGQSVRLAPQGDLTTASRAEARIRTESGIELELFENTRLPLADLEAQAGTLHLGAGAIRCQVPRLPTGQTFSVITPDATVVVHGTVFRVEVRPDGAVTKTTVRVDEGEVVVRHASGEITLVAAETWTNRSTARPAVVVPSTEPARKPADEATPKGSAPLRAASRRGADPATPGSGTLDEETRLLRAGLVAERNGNLAAAAASFELLLSRYPQSPLVPDARAALARVRMRRGKQPP